MTTSVDSAALKLYPTTHTPLRFGVAAAIVCLVFAAFTGHIWEDYFITFRASLNLATGHGLVFQPGERVHTFTSPLGTLLPALFALGGGDDVAVRALWGLRVVSALAVGGAVWIAIRAFQRSGLTPFVTTGIGTALIIDPKIVDFSVNGMETGLVILFVVLSWNALASNARVWLGVAGCAGLQWTRPDGFVFFGAIAFAWIILGNDHGMSLRVRLLTVLRIAGLGLILYLPWLAIAWGYYGSPLPHTIIAKARPHSVEGLFRLVINYPWDLVFGRTILHDIFKPAYFYLGGWPATTDWVSRIIVTGAALAWSWPRVPSAGRVASGAFFLGGFYVAYIPMSPWYYPGWQVLGWITWAYFLHASWNSRPSPRWTAMASQSLTRVVTATIASFQAVLLICVAWQMRIQQSVVEDGHRAEIGRWLARNASPQETVFVECLGYIGYYSRLKMLDYPGLSSPEVVAARRAGNRSYAQLIQTLRPSWVVLRPHEDAEVFAELPALRHTYKLAREFSSREKVNAFRILPGRGYLHFDAKFLVYHRLPPSE